MPLQIVFKMYTAMTQQSLLIQVFNSNMLACGDKMWGALCRFTLVKCRLLTSLALRGSQSEYYYRNDKM